MRPIWKKSLRGSDELWLGVPSWDMDNKEGKLSIKFAYRKNGRIPRTAPEVPEEIVLEMILMLAEQQRLSPEQADRLEQIVSRYQLQRAMRPPKLLRCFKGCCRFIDGLPVTAADYDEAVKRHPGSYPAIRAGERNAIVEGYFNCEK